jgi:uncharacterized phage protein (TIGR01671 family)|nr:MAG TPA: YopX protein [Caudoviricetes sp.]
MKDRYLFKAKHFNEWHIGNIVKEPDGLYIRDIKKNVMAFINDESTICQCTGLKDKNGKLIWENDIVKDKHGNFYIAIWWNDYYQYCWVCIKSIIEIFVGRKRDLWVIVENSEIEVIGNIFDNPELLESEE